MSKELIDGWLDNEVDEESKVHLEEWLRNNPENLQSFFAAVQLQENLRGLYCTGLEAVMLPSQKPKRVWLIVALTAVAVIIVAGLFSMPSAADLRATDDPLVWVISGNPQVEMTRIHPGPNPAPIPREQWPVATRVTTSDVPGFLRWDTGCVLEAGAGTSLTLRPATDPDVANEPRSIQLASGTLTVRLESPPVPVDIFVGDSRIRASRPTVFTVEDSGDQPVGQKVVLSVSHGDVELQLPDGRRRSVKAGEKVSPR